MVCDSFIRLYEPGTLHLSNHTNVENFFTSSLQDSISSGWSVIDFAKIALRNHRALSKIAGLSNVQQFKINIFPLTALQCCHFVRIVIED